MTNTILKVRDLIERLKTMDQDMDVYHIQKYPDWSPLYKKDVCDRLSFPANKDLEELTITDLKRVCLIGERDGL